ncbi:MAG: glycoside hydrolase [Monoraphidium minutum]|nr:MAG: glycoside hydrolase [Monoraphidium minutum]
MHSKYVFRGTLWHGALLLVLCLVAAAPLGTRASSQRQVRASSSQQAVAVDLWGAWGWRRSGRRRCLDRARAVLLRAVPPVRRSVPRAAACCAAPLGLGRRVYGVPCAPAASCLPAQAGSGPTRGSVVVDEVWRRPRPLGAADLARLRDEVLEMFDFGFNGYMAHAFPRDNLLPVSCGGADWQGGMALTLVDSLDALVLLGRGDAVADAVRRLEWALDFDIDTEVHVFEVTIRMLGGLLSGHVLLERNPAIAPAYNGSLLAAAVDLAGRMLPAFNTPSGLPASFVNLRRGTVRADNVTCTACAGTLLLEFGLLSSLTGNATYLARARHAAEAIFRRRSALGLVGSSLRTADSAWVSPDATIGPAGDSYYEYLLKAWLMTGDTHYLDMFTSLYASAMAHMRLPRLVGGVRRASFLVDVNMHSGRMARVWVSSLGAFWPAMQALAGQGDDARDLHANFTAAWSAYGWLPEMFGFDLAGVNAADGGYNLRPEHAESTFMLHGATGDPHYAGVAAAMAAAIARTRAQCGFTRILSVESGKRDDLMESYFLAETLKYLFLTFQDGAHLLTDW